MAVKRFPLFVVVLLVIYVLGAACVLLVGPRPSRRQAALIRARLYESWYQVNKEGYQAFKDLAEANGWQMYVRTNDGVRGRFGWAGIGRLDCRHSRYTPVQKTPKDRYINAVTSFQGGKGAFIECTMKFPLLWGRIKRRDFELGMLRSDGTVAKIPIPDMDLVGDIAIGKRYAFFSQFSDRAWLYDMRKDTLREVPKPGRWKLSLLKLGMLGDRFLLVGPSIPGTALSVLEASAPHAEVSRIENVWNMLVVGDHLVIEKDQVCYLYHPETGGIEGLVAGQLAAPLGKNEFLFCGPQTAHPGQSRAPLQRYRLVARSADIFWEPPEGSGGFRLQPGEKKLYDYRKVILSPDGHFLFAPRAIPTYSVDETVETFEYDIYDLRSGEKRGAFLTIHEGRFYFEFLGWVGGKNAAVQCPSATSDPPECGQEGP